MARSSSPAEEMLDGVLAQGVTPPLRAAGFRKTGRSYHRRNGGTVQVVNIQVSHGSSGMEKKFFVNVGVAFDAICELAGIPVLEKVKEYECDDRGTRSRLAEMMPGAPDDWTVQAGVDPSEVTAALLGLMQGLVAELDVIDGPVAYRSHRWFGRFRPAPANAQILYLIGDWDGARREVRDLAVFFADRKNANRAEWWVERLHLTGLAPAPPEV